MLFKRTIKDLRSRDAVVQKVIDHINSTDSTLEQKWAEIEKRIKALEEKEEA